MFAHGIMAALFFALVGIYTIRPIQGSFPILEGFAHQMPRVAAGFLIAELASLGLPGCSTSFRVCNLYRRHPGVYGACGHIIFGHRDNGHLCSESRSADLFRPRDPRWDELQDAKGVELIPIVVLCAALFLSAFFPSLIMDMIDGGVAPLAEKFISLEIGGIF